MAAIDAIRRAILYFSNMPSSCSAADPCAARTRADR